MEDDLLLIVLTLQSCFPYQLLASLFGLFPDWSVWVLAAFRVTRLTAAISTGLE